MLINQKKICVFDMETDGSDPSICSPVQIAALMIDPIKLEIIKDSEFNINLKPDKLENNTNPNENPYTDSDILQWHAKIKNVSPEKILDDWKNYPSQAKSWSQFINYLDSFHIRTNKKSLFTAPIAAGYNIFRFDLKIVERLSNKYGNINKNGEIDIFYPRDTLDLMNLLFYWFESSKDIKSLSMDNMRNYFGMSSLNAHDALKDVQDTAELLIRFLKLHRSLGKKIKFKDSFLLTANG
jgi:exonuclease I